MQIDTAVIPVAGLGTRLLPLSSATPKEMLPLGRKPALHYIAEEIGRAGIRRIVLVCSPGKQKIADYFQHNLKLTEQLRGSGKSEIAEQLWGRSRYRDIRFDIAIQHQQLGLGHAILCAENEIGDGGPFAVALGDSVIGRLGESNILERMAAVSENKYAPIVIAFQRVAADRISRFGIAAPRTEPDSNGVFELQGMVEKPDPADAPSDLAVTARYILAPEIFAVLKKLPRGRDNEYQLTDALNHLIEDGVRAFGVVLNPDENRYDVGNLKSYTEAFVEFALADKQLRDSVLEALRNFEQCNM